MPRDLEAICLKAMAKRPENRRKQIDDQERKKKADAEIKVVRARIQEREAAKRRDAYLADVRNAHAHLQKKQLEDHAREITGLIFTPDSKQLVSVSEDKTLRVWDVATRSNPFTLQYDRAFRAVSMAFQPDGGGLVVGHERVLTYLFAER